MRRIDMMLARAALERLGDVEAEADEAGHPLAPEVSARLRMDTERRIVASVDPGSITQTQEIEVRQLLSAARAMVRAEQEELLRMRDEEGLADAIVRPLLRQLDLRDQALRSGRH